MASIHDLRDLGQSVWLDGMDRRLLAGDGLAQLIRLGIGGVTGNPAPFHEALAASDAYDDAIRDLLQMDPHMAAEAIYEGLAVADVQMAADRLRPVHALSDGRDGYAGLELPPRLAYDAEATLAAARHLWRSVNRPNLMLALPATPEGLPAMEQLVVEGINVDATLLFSTERYEAVARAYLRGLARRRQAGAVASVASFLVSRIDTKADRILEAIGKPEALALRGRIAVAQARLAYRRYRAVMHSTLAQAQGKFRPQRLLWASSGVENPAYPDVLYVDSLIGPDTVVTVARETLDAFIWKTRPISPCATWRP